MPLVLGVDSSARSTRLEIRDADDGQLLASGAAAHGSPSGTSGERDPSVWWQALLDARRSAGGALSVAAVAATGQHGAVVLDEDDHVIRPAVLAGDEDVTDDAERLTEQLGGPEEWVSAVGAAPGPFHTIVLLAWLRRREPETFARIAKVLLPHDWVTFRLSNRCVTDRGGASSTGVWSPREDRWRGDLLRMVDDGKDWSGSLPRVLTAVEPAGDREGVMVAGGTGEPMATALGVGLRPRDVAVLLGTRNAAFTVRERPTEDREGLVSGLADASGRFLPLVDTVDVLSALDGIARVLGVDHARFDELALSAPPGGRGLRFLPSRVSRGAPGLAAASLLGIDGDATPELVARAAVEGVVCSILEALDHLRAAEVPMTGRLLLVGSGARSHALQRVLADLSGRTVSVPTSPERSVTGACVQASGVLHGTPPDEVAASWGLGGAREIEPDDRVDREEIRRLYAAVRT